MAQPTLSDRQRDILRRLVEEYIARGEPVGSKHLVERAGLHVSSSTVRGELAEQHHQAPLHASHIPTLPGTPERAPAL